MPFFSFIVSSIRNRSLVLALARRKFQTQFLDTALGVVWALLSPAVTVLLYWAVFSLGFKAVGTNGMPFIIYFITGFLPWLLFSDCLNAAANAIIANRHFVKKTIFPSETMPLVELLAATIPHLLFLAIVMIVLLAYKMYPGFAILQLIYGYLAIAFLSIGLGWLLGALNVFHRDIGKTVQTLIPIWFWATPIVWSMDMLPEKIKPYVALNPMLHIVEAYRNALIFGQPVWQEPLQMILFWAIALFLCIVGAHIFNRLQPNFPDAI